MAGLSRPRVSARAVNKHIRCLKGNQCAGRVAARSYGTVASTTSSQKHDLSKAQDASHLGRPFPSTATQIEPTIIKNPSASKYYPPSVLLPAEAARSPTVHKIHILGDDARSKFIAHALSGVYDSVERLAWKKTSTKYRNVQRKRADRPSYAEPLAVMPQILANESDGHIDQLVVSGKAQDTIRALQSVKHRVDENTTICLMSDGLGVLEDVRKRIFNAPDSAPNFLLGHMSHRFAYNRNLDSVKQLRVGEWQLTPGQWKGRTTSEQTKTETRLNFVESLQQAQGLNTTMTPFDTWFRFKLPTVLFDSVVEPVCVLLDLPYEGLLQNRPAQRMMDKLLSEILVVVQNLPEVEGSTALLDLVRGERARQILYHTIVGKKREPSHLVRTIRNGLPVDVDYLNGYFIRRAKQAGLSLPTNIMMREMVKAKHSQAVERMNSYIPLEETSIPSDQMYRYRTTPGRRPHV